MSRWRMTSPKQRSLYGDGKLTDGAEVRSTPVATKIRCDTDSYTDYD
jgi:hypothetical protein